MNKEQLYTAVMLNSGSLCITMLDPSMNGKTVLQHPHLHLHELNYCAFKKKNKLSRQTSRDHFMDICRMSNPTIDKNRYYT